MQVIPFAEIRSADFALTDISVIYQTPEWDRLGNKNGIKGRKLNGFLLIDQGECCYEWGQEQAVLRPGSLIYLPAGCKKLVTVTQRPFSFYRISFTMTELASAERLVFCREPWVVTGRGSKELFTLCRAMEESTLSRNGLFRSSAQMFEFFDIMAKQYQSTAVSRIGPALEYVQEHYIEAFNVARLAQKCMLSESQFYCAFKEKTGMSPIRYKNHLRIEQAKRLLKSEECTVKEVAVMLGFENVYYFSRVFKDHTGMSPTQYTQD